MAKVSIVTKLKKAKLTGRGGGYFPTAKKWEIVKNAKGSSKYVVCNASEGEPGVKKDYHILKNHPENVIDGIMAAIDFLSAKKAVIYLNPSYFSAFSRKLKQIIKNRPIEVFKKPHIAGYAGGEETSALNCLEGGKIEPRLRPPFPTTAGLYGHPTLINNVETFYAVSLINNDKYQNKRFYTIHGDCLWSGVYEFEENWTIEKILKLTKNYPDFDFFVQAGGDASGEILNSKQLKRPARGSGCITVYSTIKHEPIALMRGWARFFARESCGQCTPCREGTYRLKELLGQKEINWQLIPDIMDSLHYSSFCGLGCAAPIAIESYIKNVLSQDKNNKIKLPAKNKKNICQCFK